MHYARFRDPAGTAHKGVWTEDGIEFGGDIFDLDMVDICHPSNRRKSSVSVSTTLTTPKRQTAIVRTDRYCF